MKKCKNCEVGFPLTKDGFHYGTQALGMIPNVRCENANSHITPTNPPAKHPPPRELPPRKIWIALPKDDGRVPYMHWMKPEIRETPQGLEYRSLPGGPNDWVPVCWAVPYVSAALLQEERARAFEAALKLDGGMTIEEKMETIVAMGPEHCLKVEIAAEVLRNIRAARSPGDAEKGE